MIQIMGVSFAYLKVKKEYYLTILYLLYSIMICTANVNIYLTQWEVRRLLGVSAELFYVRDGVINYYAMGFPVPVPAHISRLYFNWEALYNQKLPYSLDVSVSNNDAIREPSVNISHSGNIPTKDETFELILDCNQGVTAEVDVYLHINITFYKLSGNITSLTFRRKKICLKEKNIALLESSNLLEVPAMEEDSYIATGCACALLTIIAAVLVVSTYYVHLKKANVNRQSARSTRNYSVNNVNGHVTLFTQNNEHFQIYPPPADSCKLSDSSTTYTGFKKLPVCNPLETDISQNKDIFELVSSLMIPRRRVRLDELILEGTFGRVYKGSLEKEASTEEEEEVLVKTVAGHASEIQVKLLLMEGMKLHTFNHINILPVIGVALENPLPPYVIYPYNNSTNLKRFLQKCKLCSEGIAHTLTTQEVVDMALQIIRGVQFMHEECIVHGDLAARNCVIDPELKVRITDSALARDLFPSDYHCLGDNVNRPIKWLAIESLEENIYTIESDVWSFGVVLWELTTLAQQPYVEIDPFEMAAYLNDGYRLAQPVNCPDELFAVMAYCWTIKPVERPTLNQLYVCLQEFYAQLTKYV